MKRIIGVAAALALSAPLLASAAQGWVVADISLQAGPDTAYPSILELRAGTPVSIQGCIDGWTWCDVSVGDDAGWVPGTFLQEEYGGQRVVVMDYGPRIGIPVVAFSLGVYWDRHYHSRPFYAQRQEWTTRSITTHAPPRPAGVAVTGAREAPATTTRDQKRAPPPISTATTPTDRNTHTARTQPAPSQPAQEPDRRTGSASTTQRQEKAERAPAPTAQPEPRTAAPSDAAPQAKAPAEPPKAAPAQRTAMHQQPKTEQKPRSNEPKPKDELKAPPKKNESDKKKDDEGGGGG